MNPIPEALADVDRAFTHLEFAVKLMCYVEAGHVDREKFDNDVTLLLEHENVSFPSNTFRLLEPLVLAAQATVGVSFGITAIVLDAAFDAAGIQRRPESDAPDDLIRTLVYMVRCAFAHNPAMPCWTARGPHARRIELQLEGVRMSVDLPALNGQPFEYQHIGGLANWFRVRRAAQDVITRSHSRD